MKRGWKSRLLLIVCSIGPPSRTNRGGVIQETTLRGLVAGIHEPVGVIGIACPDDSPLLAFVSLVAPAISRGNAVVCIPSPPSPLCATDLYQVFDTS